MYTHRDPAQAASVYVSKLTLLKRGRMLKVILIQLRQIFVYQPKLVYNALASVTIGLVVPLYCSALRHMSDMSDNTAWTVVYWRVAVYIVYV